MRLPRRVPWASIGELEQICGWIYADENDYHAKTMAINRLAAWKAITPLPHALESTLAILVVIIQDNSDTPGSSLSLRQSYATAIIRLVNGLVDPLQLGAFARSIASIAKQLGLPSWLVELRHAATHEELPSLSLLLREAARQAMAWLLQNYFLPTINPLSSSPSLAAPLRPLKPILKQYKDCMKAVTRDASLAPQYKPQITGLLRDVERWIAEAEVVAGMSLDAVGWESHQYSENIAQEGNMKERWALERLCDELLEKGGLVPLSKKKRIGSRDAFLPPPASVAIWSPLLQNVQDLHGDFSPVLCGRICSHLTFTVHPSSLSSEDHISLESSSDPSYDLCLARWAMWLIEICVPKQSVDYDLRQESVVTLLRGLSGVSSTLLRRSSAFHLLETLCDGQTELQIALDFLTQPAQRTANRNWSPSDFDVMQNRLNSLQKMVTEPAHSEKVESSNDNRLSTNAVPAPGWRQLDASSWRPCPIGVYISN
ncbi:Las1-like-domain-containing protein [Coprinopsis sp. MPI-PUGE-AT-0042]|nr:Las1-like-domain-containing protein [Coprinopsis sp. MPI-PUGE-AT-0042]